MIQGPSLLLGQNGDNNAIGPHHHLGQGLSNEGVQPQAYSLCCKAAPKGLAKIQTEVHQWRLPAHSTHIISARTVDIQSRSGSLFEERVSSQAHSLCCEAAPKALTKSRRKHTKGGFLHAAYILSLIVYLYAGLSKCECEGGILLKVLIVMPHLDLGQQYVRPAVGLTSCGCGQCHGRLIRS